MDWYDTGATITAIIIVVLFILTFSQMWYQFLSDTANNKTHYIDGASQDFVDMLGNTVVLFIIWTVAGIISAFAWPLSMPVAILAGFYIAAKHLGKQRASRKLALSKE